MAADPPSNVTSLEDRAAEQVRQSKRRLGQGDDRASGAPGFRLRPLAELLADQRPPEWLVRGYPERGDSAILFGPSGHGKSFVAIDLAASIASGTPWHGAAVKPGPVIYLAGEGQRGVTRRFDAWRLARGIPLEQSQIFVSNAAIALTVEDYARTVADVIAATGVMPALIVIDTLARHFSGNENGTEEMSAFVALVDAHLRQRFGCATLVVHHTGHAESTRERGSGALRASAEWSFMCTRDGDTVTLAWQKAKDHELPQPMAFQLVRDELPIVDDDGKAVTSAHLHRMNLQSPKVEGLGDNQSKAYAALCRLEDAHRANVANSDRDPLSARVMLADWRKATGLDRSAWRCHETLVTRGLVMIEHPYAWTTRQIIPPDRSASGPD